MTRLDGASGSVRRHPAHLTHWLFKLHSFGSQVPDYISLIFVENSKILLQSFVIFLAWIVLLVVLDQTEICIIVETRNLGGASQYAEPSFRLFSVDELARLYGLARFNWSRHDIWPGAHVGWLWVINGLFLHNHGHPWQVLSNDTASRCQPVRDEVVMVN